MTYKDYLKTEHWRAFSRKAKSGRRNKCRICGSTSFLNTHHVKYSKNNKSVLFNETLSDVRTLCNDCHKLWHKILGKTPFRSKHADRIKNLIGIGIDKETAFSKCVGKDYSIVYKKVGALTTK